MNHSKPGHLAVYCKPGLFNFTDAQVRVCIKHGYSTFFSNWGWRPMEKMAWFQCTS